MDGIEPLLDFACALRYDDLPAEVVSFVKAQVLDTMGVLIAGSAAAGVAAVVDEIGRWGSSNEATIPVFGSRASLQDTALAAATMARALDYDDIHEGALGHPSVTTIPLAFPAAEWIGRVTGRELIVAVAAGNELFVRLGLAMSAGLDNAGMAHTNQAGIFAGTTVVGRIAQLNRLQLGHAMGIAQHMVSGTLQNVLEGTLSVRVGQGLMAAQSVLAVRFARVGITGVRGVLEGKYGYFPSYHRDEYDRDFLDVGLGSDYHLLNTSVKPYPSGHLTHVAVEAGLAIHMRIAPSRRVVRAVLRTNSLTINLLDPNGTHRRNPRSLLDSQFSFRWAFAVALVRGRAGIDEFAEVNDPETQRISALTDVVLDRELDQQFAGVPAPVHASVQLDDGSQIELTAHDVPGSPTRPLTTEQLCEKFQDCCAHAAREMTEPHELQAALQGLEDLPDVTQIIRLLR